MRIAIGCAVRVCHALSLHVDDETIVVSPPKRPAASRVRAQRQRTKDEERERERVAADAAAADTSAKAVGDTVDVDDEEEEAAHDEDGGTCARALAAYMVVSSASAV